MGTLPKATRPLIGALILAFLCVGCSDTRDRIAAMDKTFADRQQTAAASLADRLIKNPDIASGGDVQFYISESVTNQALALLDGLAFTPPQAPEVTMTVKTIRADFSDGFAGLRANITATRAALSIDVVGVATLVPHPLKPASLEVNWKRMPVPEFTWRKPEPLRFTVQVDQLEPNAKWGPFSTSTKGFVADFARLQANEYLSRALPPLELPVDNLLAIKQAAEVRTFEVAEGALVASMTTSPVSWQATFSLKEPVFLKRGIHLIGDLSEPRAAK